MGGAAEPGNAIGASGDGSRDFAIFSKVAVDALPTVFMVLSITATNSPRTTAYSTAVLPLSE